MSLARILTSRAAAAAAAAGSVLLSASVLVSQTIDRRIRYTSPISAPGGAPLVAAEPAPTPLDVRAAVAVGRDALQGAVAGALAALPPVPWTQFGLSHQELAPEWIRFDAARDLYVADLPDGRVAILTLVPRIQQRVEGILSRFDEPGEAIVAIEPSTGRVLALADGGADVALGDGLARTPAAFAASTFKVITAAALLEEGSTALESETCFSGGGDGFVEADLTPTDQDRAGATTCLDMGEALAWSANLYFARRADAHLTPESLQQMAEQFGFNRPIPFELPIEPSVAQIPVDRLGFARAAAGFYSTYMSPLHGAMIQAAIANEGVMMVPALIERIEAPDGTVAYTHTPFAWRAPITPERASQLIDGQRATCTSGTARADFGQRDGWPGWIEAWGKTGTLSNRPPGGPDPDPAYIYRWFTGVGRRGDESLAVGGLVVNTPEWWIKGTYLASEALLARFPAPSP